MKIRASKNRLNLVGLALLALALVLIVAHFANRPTEPESQAQSNLAPAPASSPRNESRRPEPSPTQVDSAEEETVQYPTPPVSEGAEGWIRHFDRCTTDQQRINVLSEKQAQGNEWLLQLARHALQRGAPRVRAAALQASVTLGPSEAIALLESGLLDTDPEVRLGALHYGRELDDEARIAVLAAGLHSEEDTLRTASLTELSRETHPDAITVMNREMADNELGLRDEVWGVLKPIFEPLSGRSFSSPQDASEWWTANSNNYDSSLQWVGDLR